MGQTAKILIYLLLALTLVGISWAQLIPDEFISYPKGKVSGLTGLTMIKGEDGELKPYYRFQLQPELNLDKIGIGFDLVFLYNPDEGIRGEDGERWDDLGDYLRMIRYFRYGHRRERIYFVYGALDNVFIGHGLIMGGYSNYDRRGLRLDLNSKVAGVETVLNNISEPSLFGGRAYIRPLVGMDLPLLDRLTLGGTYITDVDPDPGEEDEEPFTVYGFDVSLPLYRGKLAEVTLYDEAAFINKHGKGNATGLGFELPGGARLKVEYRMFGEDFAPTPFNYLYEQIKTTDGVESILHEEGMKGIYSLFAWGLPRKLFTWATFEDYDNDIPRVQAEIIETGLIEKVSIRGRYTKLGIEDFRDIFDLDEKSAFTLKIGFEVFPPLELVLVHEYRFRKREEGEGYETIHKTSVEIGISMSY
jgi:hypothetical protein